MLGRGGCVNAVSLQEGLRHTLLYHVSVIHGSKNTLHGLSVQAQWSCNFRHFLLFVGESQLGVGRVEPNCRPQSQATLGGGGNLNAPF